MAQTRDSGTVLRRLLPYTTALLVAAAVYAGWTVWSRRQANRQAVQAQQEQEARRDQEVLHQLGDGSLKILTFYASPGAVHPGGRTLICYGVSNATEVKIDPPMDDVRPALSRCLEAHPRKTTDYTLTARDAAGHEARQSFTLVVK